MKLWLLRPVDPEDSPWAPWFDKNFGFVIRAETAERARAMATEQQADECREWNIEAKKYDKINPWLDPAYSSCVELLADGPEETIMRDFKAA